MKRIKLLIIALIISGSYTQAQNLKYQILQNMGVEKMQAGDLKAADSLFTESLMIFPHKDTFFNKALVKLKQNDQHGFCDFLYWAAFYGDKEADSLYKLHCLKTVKLLSSPYDSLMPLYPEKKYEIVEKNISGSRVKVSFYDKNDSIIAELKILNGTRFYSNLSYKAYYPGGTAMLNKFLENNIMYPQPAIDKKIKGKVYVAFTVDKDGYVKNEKVVSGVHELLDNEALRVIRLIGRWVPATDKGKNISSVVTLNIDFNYDTGSVQGK